PEEVVAEVVVVLDVAARAEEALAAVRAGTCLHHARDPRMPLDRCLGVAVEELEQADDVRARPLAGLIRLAEPDRAARRQAAEEPRRVPDVHHLCPAAAEAPLAAVRKPR